MIFAWKLPFSASGDAIFQTTDYQNRKSKLNKFDANNHKLIPVESDYVLSAPSAICQSAIDMPLISMGNSLVAINEDYETTQIADWNELMGTTTLYRYICQLNENTRIHFYSFREISMKYIIKCRV